MSDVKMNVTVFAKKLRVRRAELQKQHATAVIEFTRAFAHWRAALGGFLESSARSHATALTRENVYNDRYEKEWRISFFVNAPKPPKRPSDEIIRKISTRLKFLAVTGQTTVMVSERDAALYFSTEPESEDE